MVAGEKVCIKFRGGGGELTDNQRVVNGEQVLKLLGAGRDALICEYVCQSEFSASLFPDTANTIRIICGKKKGEYRNKLLLAVQRIGTKDTIPVDNVHSGGLCADVNIETGELTAAIAMRGPMERRKKKFVNHPDSGARIEGTVIPGWNDIKNKIIILTNELPYFNFIAWDVLLTDNGFCVLEGNGSSGTDLIQSQHGLRNTEYGDLYRSYGVIK